MSDYKRLVSYIYAYNRGQKDKNVGFAKVEIRNGQCKIYISLKGVYTDTPENYGVYFIVRKDGNINGVKLGNIIVKNGLGEYGAITFPGNINNSGYSFADIGGIFIGNMNNRHNVLASQWDDEEINTAKIVFPEEVETKNNKSRENAPKTKSQDSAFIENESEEETESMEVIDSEDVKEVENGQEHMKLLPFPEKSNEQYSQEEGLEEDQEAAKIAEVNGSNIMQETIEAEVKQGFEVNQALQSNWMDMFNQYNRIDAFADDDFYDCIEITPEDLKKLPLSDTNILNNSFLMHGYYGYKHILFGKVEKNGEKNLYFIGVPGVYSNREKFMSSMFGFNNFKKSHRSDSRNPYFGYWYMEFYI